MPPDEHDALAERLNGFQALMEQAMKHIQLQLDDLSEYVIGRNRFDELTKRVDKLDAFKHETRIWRNSIDRAVWLLSIVGGICISVLTALVIAWATGQMQITWK